jgi:glycosyltransferase involved in cell wall biosynthesis
VVSAAPVVSPLVTVYIATRNRANLLARALESVWAQQGVAFEVVVVDDASDDDTPARLGQWAAAGKLRWFRHEQRLGACAARNRALREARGEFVAGLDDDDEMLPGRLAALLAALRPDDAFVCASDWFAEPGRPARVRIAPPRIDASAILARNVVGNQVLAQRARVLACNGYDEALAAAQDYDLWIRMVLTHGPARGLRQPLQRIHVGPGADAGRISRSAGRRRGYWRVYRKHRALMGESVRRAHLYNLRRASGKTTRLPRDLRFFAPGNRVRLLWHAVRDALWGAPPS